MSLKIERSTVSSHRVHVCNVWMCFFPYANPVLSLSPTPSRAVCQNVSWQCVKSASAPPTSTRGAEIKTWHLKTSSKKKNTPSMHFFFSNKKGSALWLSFIKRRTRRNIQAIDLWWWPVVFRSLRRRTRRLDHVIVLNWCKKKKKAFYSKKLWVSVFT